MNFTWKYGRSLASTTLKDGTKISYEYNKDGIRTSKTIGDKTTKYQLEGNDIVRETTGDEEIWYLYDESNQLYGLSINQTSYYYEKNLQGDIVGLFDKDGKEVVTYSYDAWGNETKITGDEELAKKNPFRYRSYYYDEELGMYYLQSRYYDAEVGRFINADDVNVVGNKNNIGNTNIFTYCNNNVANKDDTSGKISLKSLLKRGWKKLSKCNNFAILIDLLITIIPAAVGLVSAYRQASKIKQVASSLKGAASMNNAKKKMSNQLKAIANKMVKYASKAVRNAFLGLIPTIINCILTVVGTSIGGIIAKIIDRYDKKRNNGYCFR